MRMNRSVMVADDRAQVFHVISRVVDRNMIFGEEEKGEFLSYMRAFEAFSGVEVLTYCLMGNHFHLLLHVPVRPETISDEEVRRRMAFLYGKQKLSELYKEIEERKEMGDPNFEKDFYDRLRLRMYDLSSFVKDLKLRFSKWYNKGNDRKGTLWEDRFRSVMVEPCEEAMMRVSAYIELNSVRAGLVSEPHEYKWCSYTEAVAGGKLARAGIEKVAAGLGGKMKWDKVSRIYRSYFLYKAAEQNHKKPGLDHDQYVEATENDGELSVQEQFKVRQRYFTEGVAIGSLKFLKDFLNNKRDRIGEHRKNPGFKIDAGKSDLFSYRQVK